MVEHGDVLDDLILVGCLEPLQKRVDGEGNVVDGKAAHFCDVGEIWVLRLFFDL